MGSIKDKVAIIGMGCTKFGENFDKSANDMIIDAAYEAYNDAGIEPNDIDAAWYGTYISGFTGQQLAEPLKLDFKPITRVENMCATALDAIRNAAYGIASGVYDIVLALGVEKLKDTGIIGLPDAELVASTGWIGEAKTYRSQTETAPGHFAMLATSYFNKYNMSVEEGKKICAEIEVKNHYNGTLSPKAHFRKEITVDMVLKAPTVAWPLGLFDCCGVSDGAAAAILVRADRAKEFRSDPIFIKALQMAVGPTGWGWKDPDYDWTYIAETRHASQAAYAEAGISNPRKEISIANVHDCFSITELVNYEDLGFSQQGKASDDVKAGRFTLEGEQPVNTDGGLKCFGHPIGASGLRMVYELYKQLQGKADTRQVKDPKVGLAHNLGGFPGSTTCGVVIVGV
ncbi:acetyl-CoA acetyltransferase [Thermodesulfobacteriota bacterium]